MESLHYWQMHAQFDVIVALRDICRKRISLAANLRERLIRSMDGGCEHQDPAPLAPDGVVD